MLAKGTASGMRRTQENKNELTKGGTEMKRENVMERERERVSFSAKLFEQRMMNW